MIAGKSRGFLIIIAAAGGVLAGIPWWSSAWFLLFVCWIPLLVIEDLLHEEDGGVMQLLPFTLVFFITWNLVATWWIIRIHFIGGSSVIVLNAVLMSLIFLLYAAIKRWTGGGTAVLVILWTGFEFIHHFGELSWPWLSLGNGLGAVKLIQWYEYTGMMGGTLWVLIINAVVHGIIKNNFSGINKSGAVRTAILVLLVAFPAGMSFHLYHSREPGGDQVSFLILQPVKDPYGDKFTFNEQAKLEQLLMLAGKGIDRPVDWIVAPETSVDSVWPENGNDQSVSRILEFIAGHPGTGMILGASTFHHVPPAERSYTTRSDGKGNQFNVRNSAIYFSSGNVSGIYHKHILANGVEKVPFQNHFDFSGLLSVNMGGVSGSLEKGRGPEIFMIPGEGAHSLGTMICFESSYGRYAAAMAAKGAGIIILLSNDGWFKNTGAWRQHLRLARIRAIETRRDIIRAANTGISCHINLRGDIADKLGWWEEGSFYANASPQQGITLYARYGDYIGRAALFFSLLMVLNLGVRWLSAKYR